MGKAKPIEWCRCEVPQPLVDGAGEPFTAQGQCQACHLPRRRRPPGVPIQLSHPGPAWSSAGPCPPPPEAATEAYARGIALASDPDAQRQLVRAAPSPSSALAKPCPDPAAALALLRRLRGL